MNTRQELVVNEADQEVDLNDEVVADIAMPTTADETAENGDGFCRVFKNVSSMAVPMALSYTFSFEVFFTVILLNYINTTDDENAATTLIAVMMNTLVILGMAPLFGMAIQASNKVGELERAEANSEDETVLEEKRTNIAMINHHGMYMSAALAPPVVLGLVFSKSILTNVFRQNENIAGIAQNFLRVYSAAVPALISRIASEQMMFSFNRSKAAMIIGLCDMGLGTGLSLLLGLGWLGFPKLGAVGVAIGYIAESYLTALGYALYLLVHKDFKKFHFFNVMRSNHHKFTQFKALLSLSAPISFAVATEMAVTMSMGVLSGLIGQSEQAAMNFVNQYAFFVFILTAAFSQTCAQEISRLVGAKYFNRASSSGIYGLMTSAIYVSPIPVLFAIFPKLLLLTTNVPKEDLLKILTYLVPIMSVGIILDSMRYNMLQQLRPLGDLKYSMLMSVSGLGLGVLLSSILGLKTSMGIAGVATGYAIGSGVAGAGLFALWQKKVRPSIIEQTAETKDKPSKICSSLFSIFSRNKQPSNVGINHEASPLLLASGCNA